MRILITGMNKNQCVENFWQGQQLKVIPSHLSLTACLRDMGHQVEQRNITIGEDLAEYDEVIVFIHNPGGFAERFYQGLWAIHKRPDCILAFDDWQTRTMYHNIKRHRLPERLFKEYLKERHKNTIPPNIEDYQEQLQDAIDIIMDMKNRMLISAFAGGDISLVLPDYPKELLFQYNPNPYHFNRKPEVSLFPEPKQRVFNFAGLMQNKTEGWLNRQGIDETSWPLKQYGSKNNGQDRVTEDVMVTIYSQQWGILMPGYNHKGSGWWRARPLQVADAGSILIGDPKEMMIYYKDEELANITAKDLINKSDLELEAIAKAQQDAIYKNHPLDKNIQKQEIQKVFDTKEI